MIGPAFVFAPIRHIQRRFGRASSRTLIRRIPILLAIGMLIVMAPFARKINRLLGDQTESNTFTSVKQDARARLLATAVYLGGGQRLVDDLVFVVHPKSKTFEKLGTTKIEPPLFALAERADSEATDQWFSQQDTNFASFSQKYDDDTTIVALVDMGWWGPYVAKERNQVARWVMAGWIGIGLSTFVLGHVLLSPARKILRERTDFLADAAHELRTPLAVIQASAGHALARERSEGEYIRALSEIRSAAVRAGSGVSELLDLARFDAGQVMPRLAPLRLDLLAEEIASSTRVDGCDVVAETGPSVLVQADMALLRQAIDNIVRNAAARSTSVVLRSSISGADGLIEVIDNGPGFKSEQLPYVFERYRRGDSRGSAGLGLPIAASIVAAHGGRIDVASPNNAALEHPAPLDEDRVPVRLQDSMFPVAGPGATVSIRLPRSRQ
jgi:signal transduction histidine kinase